MLGLATKTAVPILAASGLFERLAGMTYKVERKEQVTTNSNGDAVFKIQTFPVSSNLTVSQCWEQQRYKQLVPDITLRSMGYFETLQPVVRLKDQKLGTKYHSKAKSDMVIFRGVLRFVYVANVAKMNFNNTLSDESNVDAVFIQSILSYLDDKKFPVNDTIFTNCYVEFKMKGGVKKDHKKVFEYTYDDLNISTLGLYPITFGAIDFEVNLFINKSCVQNITVGTPLDCKII